MRRFEKLKKDFTKSVSQLSPDEVREQLVLAYLHMEKCQEVLKGNDVEPEKMMDNGESSDLELFYRCKKVADELNYLNQKVREGKKVGTIEFEVRVDFSKLKKDMGKLISSKWPYIEDTLSELEMEFAKQKQKENFLRFKEELSKISESLRKDDKQKSRFSKGQEVWYMFGDRVQHSTIEYQMRDVDGIAIYKTALGHSTAECETFDSLEELMENLKNTING